MKKKYGLPGCTDEKGYPRTGLMIGYLRVAGLRLREVLKLLEFISLLFSFQGLSLQNDSKRKNDDPY